jgi:endonuclease YncB( thermonuclease family)
MKDEYPAHVKRIVDGDTIVFTLDLNFGIKKVAEIRLLGVDTAETYGVSHDSKEYKTGKKHERFVREWLNQADSLTVRTDEQGKFGRWLGEVFNEKGESLNDALLDNFDIEYQ